MARVQKKIGLSRDLIVHPCETLDEVMKTKGMSQSELAVRTGMSEKHVSTVLSGQSNISAAFAKRLEYALGIEMAFWLNLQSNYDRELLEYEELHQITQEEFGILKRLKDVIAYWQQNEILQKYLDDIGKVLELRNLFGVSNLLDITKLQHALAYRIQSKNINIDPYVICAWQKNCEIVTQDQKPQRLDVELLRMKIPDIKRTMFLGANQMRVALKKIFNECGIAFEIVRNFKGAPVQGYIGMQQDQSIILCITLRQKFADIFWFTLFHEIAHIINKDVKNSYVDFYSNQTDTNKQSKIIMNKEKKADKLASRFLIDEGKYKEFITRKEYSTSSIKEFAKSQNIKDYIVIGRLMNEGSISWNSMRREQYEWATN